MKTYMYPLYDNTEDKIVGVLKVTTNHTKQGFLDDYFSARNKWFDEENPVSLKEYLEEELSELGHNVSIEMFYAHDLLIY